MAIDQMMRGIVVEGRGSQVRVRFEGNDALLSPWLDVMQLSTSGMRMFTRPKPGSQVICQMDAHRESGVVLGAIYSERDPAPDGDEGTLHFEMPDGSTMIWEGDVLKIDHASGISFTLAGGKLVIDGDCEITKDLKVGGDLAVAGDVAVDGETELQDTKINDIPQAGA